MVQGLELVGIYICLELHKQYSKIIESGRSQYYQEQIFLMLNLQNNLTVSKYILQCEPIQR